MCIWSKSEEEERITQAEENIVSASSSLRTNTIFVILSYCFFSFFWYLRSFFYLLFVALGDCYSASLSLLPYRRRSFILPFLINDPLTWTLYCNTAKLLLRPLLEPLPPLQPPAWHCLLFQLSQYPDFDRNGHGSSALPHHSRFTPQDNIVWSPSSIFFYICVSHPHQHFLDQEQ